MLPPADRRLLTSIGRHFSSWFNMKVLGPKLYHMLGFRPTGDLGPLTYYTSARNKIVFFPKAPPLHPPSYLQTVQRNRYRLAAIAWNDLPEVERLNWEKIAKTAKLTINGYNLFVWYYLRNGGATIQAFQDRYSIQVLPLMWSVP
jgi:hypothetical protein